MGRPTINIDIEVGSDGDNEVSELSGLLSKTTDRTEDPGDSGKFDLAIDTGDGMLLITGQISDFYRALKFLGETGSSNETGGF